MSEPREIEAYYVRDEERERLADGKGRLEFERTQEILLRALPPAPSTVADAGLDLVDLVGVEGMPLSSEDGLERQADPRDWAVLLESAPALERVPELLGMSPHLIATARCRR